MPAPPRRGGAPLMDENACQMRGSMPLSERSASVTPVWEAEASPTQSRPNRQNRQETIFYVTAHVTLGRDTLELMKIASTPTASSGGALNEIEGGRGDFSRSLLVRGRLKPPLPNQD
jgi:hypothetical protein